MIEWTISFVRKHWVELQNMNCCSWEAVSPICVVFSLCSWQQWMSIFSWPYKNTAVLNEAKRGKNSFSKLHSSSLVFMVKSALCLNLIYVAVGFHPTLREYRSKDLITMLFCSGFHLAAARFSAWFVRRAHSAWICYARAVTPTPRVAYHFNFTASL